MLRGLTYSVVVAIAVFVAACSPTSELSDATTAVPMTTSSMPPPVSGSFPLDTDSSPPTTLPTPTPSTTGIAPIDDEVRFVSEEHGFEVTYPSNWYRADKVLAPALTSPPNDIEEILSLGTYPLRPGGSKCHHVPLNAVFDLGPEDVLISMVLGAGTSDPWPAEFGPDPWPAEFGPDSFLPRSTPSDAPVDAQTCSGRQDLEYRWGFFTLEGRSVHVFVFVALGESVDEATQAETWRVLDSFAWTSTTRDSAEAGASVG